MAERSEDTGDGPSRGTWEDRLLVSRPQPQRPPEATAPPPEPPDPGGPTRPDVFADVGDPPNPDDPSNLGAPSNPGDPSNPGVPEGEGARGAASEFAPDVTGRPVWRLLLRGLGVYLPGWRPPAGALRVPGPPAAQSSYGFGPPAFLNGDAGFGLHLAERRRGLEPDREIYVRGRDDRSFGIVIAGPVAAIGTRIVDAEELLRYARMLTFEELIEPADPDSVPYAVRAARAVRNVVFLDRAAGIGLCAEVDPETQDVLCPVFVRIGSPSERTVRAYGVAAAQVVRSQS